MLSRCKLFTRFVLVPIPLMVYLVAMYRFNTKCFKEVDSTRGMSPVSQAVSGKRFINKDDRGDQRKVTRQKTERVSSSGFKETYGQSPSHASWMERNWSEAGSYDAVVQEHKGFYDFNCSNIPFIRLIKKVGQGVSKQTYLGQYQGKQVALKMVTRHQADVKQCLVKLSNKTGTDPSTDKRREKCYIFPTMKLMKETLMLQQLNHPGIVKLLGYCVRSEESEASDLSEHGVVVIQELGSRFMLSSLQVLPWLTRLKHARDLASLLYYLQYSPLGSLIVPDFKEDHFLMAGETLKLTDFDDVNNIEPPCPTDIVKHSSSVNVPGTPVSCEFNLQCQAGKCIGVNAKRNLKNMRNLFFKLLLFPGSFPEEIAREITRINVELDTISIDAEELFHRLSDLLQFPVGQSPS